MRFLGSLAVLCCFLGSRFTGPTVGQQKVDDNPHIAGTPPRTPAEQQKLFHLPAGFVIELVAAEPDINKPINIAFDAKGRLWVTGSVEYPYAAEKGKKPRDRLVILSDFAPNGLARKVVTYADGLNIPIGVLPLSGAESAVVYSIPNIYLLSGKDKADKRDVLYSGYGYRDTHGMTGEFVHGFDGWIYCCHGYANNSTVKGKRAESISMHSGNTYRIKPDGSRIEYFTHGQVNPFGLTFDPAGNLYSCDCHSQPIYQLLRGAWYPSFEKPHDGLGFGPEMMRHDHGSTAIAGIAYYADDRWPEEYRDNIFVGNVVTNRINRDRIEWHGSTPNAIEMPDFVKCDDPWFRPVDIKLGPDGNLYVADFYNRIIGHYEVPLNHPGRDREKGRIWRIRYVGAKDPSDQTKIEDLTQLGVKDLAARLGRSNLGVRLLAAELLVSIGNNAVKEAVASAMEQGNEFQRAHGLWILDRLNALKDDVLNRCAVSVPRLVRVHAMRVLAQKQWTDNDWALVLGGLKDPDPLVRRTAVEAIGTQPKAEHVDPLLKLHHQVPAKDTHLLHVVRMALRDQIRPKETWTTLAKREWEEKDARALADVCLGARTPETADFLKDFSVRWRVDAPTFLRNAHYITRNAEDGAGDWVIVRVRDQSAKDLAFQAQTLKVVYQARQERGGGVSQMCMDLARTVAVKLLAEGSDHEQIGIDLAGTYKIADAMPALSKLVASSQSKEATRKSALVALLAIDSKKNIAALAALLNDPKTPIGLREGIATNLAGTNQAEAHAVLLKALESAPASLQTSIALGMAGSTQGAEKLLQAVDFGKASARLLQERPVELRLKQARVAKLDERLAKLTKGLPPADQRMQELLAKRRDAYLAAKPDAKLGIALFEKHCAACHQIAGKGSKIAPHLDGIGIRGLERLLEDTLDPNRNVDQAFRSTTLVLDNGQIMSGLFLSQEGKVLIMADAQGKEVRILESSVQERTTSPLSPMPGNFAEQIPEADLHHLLAYLLAQRPKD
ncbi:MAG: c-type cytochrome [Planctomycetes bacterium]|nr:c-type cytochrome [Planctomycetota bacterium]